MIMTPGVGFFYGGLVRKKNFIDMITLSFVAFALVSVQWVLIGYSLAFGPDVGGFIGNLQYLGLNGVSMSEPGPYSTLIPGMLYMVFQLVFATVTMAIVTSGFAERIKFSSYLVFALPLDNDRLRPACTLGLGRRLDIPVRRNRFRRRHGRPYQLGFRSSCACPCDRETCRIREVRDGAGQYPVVDLGAVLLWFGWFGFNAGSAVAANGLAVQAFVTTNTATATAALVWMLVSWAYGGKPSSLGIASGAVAGLVAITPAAGFVTVPASIVIGAVAGAMCYGVMLWRQGKGIDESLDAWAVHGMGGLWGAIATGIFASAAVNGASGLLEGNVHQFIAQIIGAGAAVIYAFVVTYILAVIVDKAMGLRVSEEEEYVGLDISQHGERA